MITKKIFVFFLLFSLTSIFSKDIAKIEPDQWKNIEIFSNERFSFNILEKYNKKIIEQTIYIPEEYNNKILYLNITKNIGYSKIFLNDKFFATVGSIEQITQIKSSNLKTFSIPVGVRNNISKNSLKIINYSKINSSNPVINIRTNRLNSIPYMVIQKVSQSVPITFAFITLIILTLYAKYKDSDEGKERYLYRISLILFLFYFLFTGMEPDIYIKQTIIYLMQPVSITAWLLFMIYYVKKYNIWNMKQILIVTIIVIIAMLSLTIINTFSILILNIYIFLKIIILLLNLLFLVLTIQKPQANMKFFIVGLSLSLLLHICSLSLELFYKNTSFILYQTASIIVIIFYFITLFNAVLKKIETNNEFINKLFDSIEKNKMEILKKENTISELKVSNDDIIKEHSLFFSTLGRNLRAPLNSIIGYSENLYSTDRIEDVNPLVTEIIIESDKIFQSINNLMDFSTRDFTSNDLQLKDFRMKEIFNNAVYETPEIQDFKNKIIYEAIGVSDKVLIKGNPLIYKQMITNVFQFLISMSPETINYTLSNTGINDEYMNLEGDFKAKNLTDSKISLIKPLYTKEVFKKYIKLYNIEFNEELNDFDYNINIKFQCGISKNQNNPKVVVPTKYELDRVLNVLVVEDYIPNLNIVKMHLEKMGCNVFTATNGEDAIFIFNNEFIDIILMDIKMPIMDGWEATEQIRSSKNGLNTLIIGLTASSLDLDIRHCFESGMDDVQVKPIRKNQLYKKLQSFSDFKPEKFPSISTLRADYGISKIETETLFISTIKQISKQLEVLDVFVAANDDVGVGKEMPSIINAALLINGFYFSRLLRNFNDAYIKKDIVRIKSVLSQLNEIIDQVKEENEILFRD